MRLAVIPAEQLGTAKSQGVRPAGQRKVVGNLGARGDGEVWQEDVGPQIVDESEDLQSYLSRLVGNHIEAVVIPLDPELVLRLRTKRVVPPELNVVVVIVDRAARRKACQGLHIRVFLEIVAIPIAQIELVVFAKMMVHAPRGKVLAGVVVEHASVVFKLVYQEGAQRRSSGIEGQSSTKNRGASAGGHIGGRIRGG